MKHLSRSWKHPLASVQPCSTGILYLFDLAPPFADDGPHPRVRDHELDSYRAATGDGRFVERLVIYSSYDETECLYAHVK